MRRPSPRHVGLTLGLALAGCGDPCRELSDIICRCEPDPALRRQCEQKVGVRASQYAAPADRAADQRGQQRCQQRLETCTCEALQARDFAACGLTPDATP